jgi:phosphoribosyl-AMP cyclohydrolase
LSVSLCFRAPPVATVGATSYTVTGLSSKLTTLFTVKSKDASGNLSTANGNCNYWNRSRNILRFKGETAADEYIKRSS